MLAFFKKYPGVKIKQNKCTEDCLQLMQRLEGKTKYRNKIVLIVKNQIIRAQMGRDQMPIEVMSRLVGWGFYVTFSDISAI